MTPTPDSGGPQPALFGAVLIGGEGRRLEGAIGGPPKPFVRIAGVRMVDRAIAALRPHVSEIFLLTASSGVNETSVGGGASLVPGVGTLRDEVPDRGPIEGLRVALKTAREGEFAAVVLVAADLPFVDASLVGRVISEFQADGGARPVVLSTSDESPSPIHDLHPLAGVYPVSAFPDVEAAATASDRSMKSLLSRLSARDLLCREAGVDPLRLANVNTPNELRRARALSPTLDGPPVVCVVGWKDTGKTTLAVRLVEELVRRGRRVMTAKHGHRFQLDTPGTDSHRHRHEAGAHRVALVGPDGMAVMGEWPAEGEPTLRTVIHRYLADAEVVVAEGWKGGIEPKIEVHRAEKGDPIVSGDPTNARTFLALVTDRPDDFRRSREGENDTQSPRLFDLNGPDTISRLADLVEGVVLDSNGG